MNGFLNLSPEEDFWESRNTVYKEVNTYTLVKADEGESRYIEKKKC